jgi:glycosyltransferase involved in cell wall biosynthesis
VKIVHLTSLHPPDDNRIFKICRSIASAGRVVSLIVPTDKDCVIDGVAIKAVPRVLTRWKRMLCTTWQVYRRAVHEQADIYQFHDPELIPVGLALRWFSKCEVIYDVHENVPEQILSKPYIPRLVRKAVAAAYDRFERYSAKKFSAIVTTNEDISERFSCIADRVVAIHNYADNGEFSRPGETDDSRYESGLVLHSAASERTSFPAVLRALEWVPNDVAIKLLVTAVTADEADAVAQGVQRSPSRRIEVLGVLAREDFARLLSQCAVSIVLYNEQRNHSGIRANRFYESLAAAAPVITPDFPEWRTTVESIGCGLTVNPTDSRAIAGALQYLLTHPAEAAAMGKRGRCAFLQEFDWIRERGRLLQLYDTLLASGQPTEEIAVTTT